MGATPTRHHPVLFDEVMAGLAPGPGGTFLDGTLGGGGHAAGLLERSAPDGRLLGLDQDPAALARAASALATFGDRATLARGSFARLDVLAEEHGFAQFDGILLDLGFSSDQLADAGRGFSFQADGPLDMRLDPDGPVTAADLVNQLETDELANLIYEYGEERRSRRVARAIVAARPISTTLRLAEVVAKALGGRRGGIHPATRTFQALRIAVNEELSALAEALPRAIARLVAGGRLAVISFHSLEDRIVKQLFKAESTDCLCPPGLPVCRCGHVASIRLVTRRPLSAGAAELAANPRARSARLRIAERLAPVSLPPLPGGTHAPHPDPAGG